MGYPHFAGDCNHNNCIITEEIQRQIEWSAATFGPGVRKGVIKHIQKELKEVEKAGYTDTEEWVDIMILAIDGAWRGGATPTEIFETLKAKWEKNRNRTWPDWRTVDRNQAIEHIREIL